MKFRNLVLSLLVPFLCFGISTPSQASQASQAYSYSAKDDTQLPNIISVGVGYFDVIKNDPMKSAIDMRLEHRWGMSLLPMANPYFKSWNPYFQVHPMMGLEVTHRAQVYANAGFAMDILLGRHVILTESELVGLYGKGNGKKMGSVIEFRSQLEAGWRFDNEMRMSAYIGHISNAGIGDINPGAEIAGGYLHVPTNFFMGK